MCGRGVRTTSASLENVIDTAFDDGPSGIARHVPNVMNPGFPLRQRQSRPDSKWCSERVETELASELLLNLTNPGNLRVQQGRRRCVASALTLYQPPNFIGDRLGCTDNVNWTIICDGVLRHTLRSGRFRALK